MAVKEIKRLVKHGGCFGWVEHVAVDLKSDRATANLVFLNFQQKMLDPLQQVVAHNCHLHRETDRTIKDIFDSDADILETERFFISSMWPVSCQVSGVLKARKQ